MKGFIKSALKRVPALERLARGLLGRNAPAQQQIVRQISGEGNRLQLSGAAVCDKLLIDIEGAHNTVEIEGAALLNNLTIYIRGDHNTVKIGAEVQFNRGGSIWIEDHHGEASIGKATTFEDVHIAVTEPYSKIEIGEDCMFAYDIDLRTGDSHSILDAGTNKRINYAKNIRIGNHVWVASHVSVLKGVSIADNCIVASRAVVTKPFTEPNVLIGGMPGKVMKTGINWDRRRIYE